LPEGKTACVKNGRLKQASREVGEQKPENGDARMSGSVGGVSIQGKGTKG